MTTDCRLIIDAPAPGVWNMAADEALLAWSAQTDACCLRLYRWSEPTLSLGYFQRYQDRRLHPPSLDCPVVRRPSGGGAILHDDELTYSLVLPGRHPLAVRTPVLYRAVHTTLIEVLAELGLVGRLWDPAETPAEARRPFLCFHRRATGDIVVDDTKIVGSAQRRRQSVLQHGSILLGRSKAAPELDGLAQLLGTAVSSEDFARAWLPRVAAALGVSWTRHALGKAERSAALEIAQRKYAADSWTKNRGRELRSGDKTG